MDVKKLIQKQGMKLMQDPRVMKLMQDERVMKAMMQAFQMRGKAQENFDQVVERLAKRLGLVTKAEVRELKRTIKKLEKALEKTQNIAEQARDAKKA